MNNVVAYNILKWSSVLIQLVPIATISFRKAFNPQLKALFIYFIISFLSEMLLWAIGTLISGDAFLLMNIYTLLEFLIILYIYYKEFSFKNPYPLLLLGIAFLCLTCRQLTRQYNDPEFSTEAIIIIGFSVVYFFRLSNDITIPKLTDFYFFWINSAFLFYFSISFFLFLFLHYINGADESVSRFLWGIHLVANIIYNVLFTIGICKIKATSRN